MPVGTVGNTSSSPIQSCNTPPPELGLPAEVAQKARTVVGEKLGVAAEAVSLTHASETVFRNSGLGLPGSSPVLTAITPGHVITARTADTVAVVHAGRGNAGVLATLPREAAEVSAAAVGAKLEVGAEKVQITNATETMFRNGSLGGVFEGPATMALVPGWIVSAKVGDQTFTVHTDGRKAGIKPEPQAERNEDGFEVG